jgi:hypothetical protein
MENPQRKGPVGLEAVFVTNTNKEYHEDMFDGVKYEFHPNEPVCIPLNAAVHIFAYGGDLDAKKRAVARVSKDKVVNQDAATRTSSTLDTMAEGLVWLERFEFESGEFVPKKAKSKKDDKLSGLE